MSNVTQCRVNSPVFGNLGLQGCWEVLHVWLNQLPMVLIGMPNVAQNIALHTGYVVPSSYCKWYDKEVARLYCLDLWTVVLPPEK